MEALLADADLRISRGRRARCRGALLASLQTALALETSRWEDALGSEPLLPDAVLAPLKNTFNHLAQALGDRVGALERLYAAGPLPELPAEIPEVPEHPPKDPEAAAQLWASAGALGEALQALEAWVTALAWPREGALPPEALAARRQRDALSQTARGLDALAQRAKARAEKRVQRFDRALASEQTKAAGGMLAELKTLHPALPPVHRGDIDLDALEAQYQALRDQLFEASLVAREGLIAQLEALAATAVEDENAEAREAAGKQRAEDVKALRGAWNGLGPARGSGQGPAEALRCGGGSGLRAGPGGLRSPKPATSREYRGAGSASKDPRGDPRCGELGGARLEIPRSPLSPEQCPMAGARARGSWRTAPGRPFFSRMRGLKTQLEARWRRTWRPSGPS